jgi:DNA-binding MarR family transcriptional regulator
MRMTGRTEPHRAADMAALRHAIVQTCQREGYDFDTLNAWLTLKRTGADLDNFSTEYCKQFGLTPGRWGVLLVLNANDNRPLSLTEMGEHLLCSRPNITGLIDALVEEGLVRRIHHPEDRRIILAQLTPQGRDFVRTHIPYHYRAVSLAMSALTRQEKRQLVALLDKLRAHVNAAGIPHPEAV